jgi:hypothetical protein
MEGVISRLTLTESNRTTAGDGLTVLFFSWVVFSEQTCTECQNHPLALPIRLVAISSSCCQRAGTQPRSPWPGTGARARGQPLLPT